MIVTKKATGLIRFTSVCESKSHQIIVIVFIKCRNASLSIAGFEEEEKVTCNLCTGVMQCIFICLS